MSRCIPFAACLLFATSAFAIDPPTIFRVEPDHSSTELEGALRGFGAAAEGLGVGLHHNAAGQVLLQEARSLAIKNHYEALDQKARLKSEHDMKQRELRQSPSQADLARRAREAAPARLSRNDATTSGELLFPIALLDERFDEVRVELQDCFRNWRTAPSTTDAAQWKKEVEARCETLASALQKQVRTMSPNDYMAAKRFLERCAHETRFSGSRLPAGMDAPTLATK